jgi:hypothetical protein
MIDPCSIEGRIDGEPTMEEHNDRDAFRFRLGWLEQPVRPRAFSQFVPHDHAMLVNRSRLRGSIADGGPADLILTRSCTAHARQHDYDHRTGHQTDNAPRRSHPWRAWHFSVPLFSYPEFILDSRHKLAHLFWHVKAMWNE